jgi:cell wall-associated NlpC family hydrolase
VAPTHRVAALRTYIYPSPDIKLPPLALLSLNALIAAVSEEGNFLVLQNGGFVFAKHTRRAGEWAPDYVAVAECFLGTPYLWGGRTSVGLDCSGLVQLAAEAAGLACPRDTDMQEAEFGLAVDWQAPELLMRGDLVFWEGHVGIMTDADTMLHANAHHMATEIETLAKARARLAAAGLEITSVRRLPPRRGEPS